MANNDYITVNQLQTSMARVKTNLDKKANVNHGTHVTYGTSTSTLTTGVAGVVGTSASVARADHTHSLNLNAAKIGALPLSGGTITNGTFGGGLNIKRTGTGGAAIKFTNDNGTLGYICMNAVDGNLKRYKSDGSTYYDLVDTNNIKSLVTLDSLNGAHKNHTHNYAGSSTVGGPASYALALSNARAIKLTGAVTGSYNTFNGTSDANIATTLSDLESNKVTKMTGYSKPTATSAIATTDSLNTAIGKLEKALDSKQNSGSYAPINHTHAAATTSAAGFMSATDKGKLDGIAAGANAYSHPTSSGNKHIPSGGSSGQFLGWSADGTAKWVSNPNSDTKVTNTASATTRAYITGTTSSATNTGTQVFDPGVYLDTTAGTLVATTFKGALSGNAASATTASSASSATKASQDSSGQTITSTYIKGLSVSGRTITYTKGDGSTGTITTQDNNTTYSTGTSSTAGLTKLYTSTGTATDGTMTQAAINTALSGKAASSHSHNYAGSGSVGGSANSAVKLATARTINDVSFDGTGNIYIPLKTWTSSVDSDNSKPYHRILTLPTKLTATYQDRSIIVMASGNYSGGPFGIFRVIVRTNNTGQLSTCNIEWLVRYDIPLESIIYNIIATSGATEVDIFYRCAAAYECMTWTVLGECNARSSVRYTNNSWTKINTNASTPTEVYTASEMELLKPYTSTLNAGTDVGNTASASYANSAYKLQTSRTINGTNFDGTSGIVTANWGTARNIKIGNSTKSVNGSANVSWTLSEIGAAAASHTHNYAGSSSAGGAANSAVVLATARTINGTSFNGSANITTSNWGTARTLTIGSTGKSVNGSGNVSWSLSEIGAAPASHSHSYLPLSGGTVSGNLTVSNTFKVGNNFSVFNNGNTKIGGSTGQTIEGHERADLEITSNGTIYSTSATQSGVYARLTEGRIYLINGGNSTTIDGGNIQTHSVASSGNLELKGGAACTVIARTLSGTTGYFNPSDNGKVRLGSSSHRWNVLYSSAACNISSDRNLKENIKYIDDGHINSAAKTDDNITLDDMYSFVRDELGLATYNLISNNNPKDVKLGFIAQDMLYTSKCEESKIGQLIVNAKEAVDDNTTLAYDAGNYTSVLAGALKQAINKIEILETRIQLLESK